MSLPDPLNQNLHFSRILRPHVCTLKFESTGVLNITDFASLAIMAPSFVSNTLILFSWDALPSLACEKDRVGLSTGIFLILAKGSEHSTWVQQIKFCLLHVWHKYQKWLKVLIPNTVQKKKKKPYSLDLTLLGCLGFFPFRVLASPLTLQASSCAFLL